jgi:hypothetical protein
MFIGISLQESKSTSKVSRPLILSIKLHPNRNKNESKRGSILSFFIFLGVFVQSIYKKNIYSQRKFSQF